MNKILIFTLGLSLTPVVMAEKTTKDLTTIDQYSGISWVRKSSNYSARSCQYFRQDRKNRNY